MWPCVLCHSFDLMCNWDCIYVGPNQALLVGSHVLGTLEFECLCNLGIGGM